jgi:hypothetical protein
VIGGGVLGIVGAVAAMAVKDATGTLMVVAEARNRAHLAGVMGASSGVAVVLTTYFGAGEIIVHGWTTYSFVVLAAICATSYAGTRFWTGYGNRVMQRDKGDSV